MRIAITGAEGQLGSELCRRLGDEAIALDLPDFDLTDRQGVVATLLDLRPEAVVNTAAYTAVDKAEDQPELCWRVNTEGVAAVAEACRALDIPLVQISTDYVFGAGGRNQPYRETDEPSPQGVYARSKLEGEREAARWTRHFVVRTCGLYGRRGKRAAGNFVETMLRAAQSGKAIRVVGDQQCTPTYVPHLAKAVLFLLGTQRYGIYHVVNTGETTWYDFAREIFGRLGLRPPLEKITTAQYGAPAPRPSYSVLDTGKYHSLPGRPAMPPWQDALAEYLGAREMPAQEGLARRQAHLFDGTP